MKTDGAISPTLILRRNRTCNGCYAYNQSSLWTGSCALGFMVEQLPKDGMHCGRFGGGEYWTVHCKPAEPCMKPKTSREYTSAFSIRHRPTNK